MCCRRINASRWRSSAAAARVSTMSTDASIWTSCPASASPRSVMHIPGLAAAIAEQASTLLHTSNLYYHPYQAEAAARLSALSGLARVFFCNSGTEANEACLKFARRYWHTQGVKGRVGFVAIEGGFAGRTMGALSVTHDEHYRGPFLPLLEPVTFVPDTRPDLLAAAVNDRTAAVIAEPIRGEGGIRPLPARVRAGDQRRLQTHGHAAHRRRSAERTRPHGLSVPLAGDRMAAGSHLGRQGARLGRADRRSTGVRARRTDDLARRPWQHLRRQSAGDTRRGVCARAVDGSRADRTRQDRRRPLRAAAADARAEAPGDRRGSRRGRHARSCS